MKNLSFIALTLGLLSFVGWAIATDWIAPIITTDTRQERVNTAATVPNESVSLSQQFTPQADGLNSLEFTLVRHKSDEGALAPAGTEGQLILRLFDEAGIQLREGVFETAGLGHNQTLTWEFTPIQRTVGETLTLEISGNNNRHVTVWGYDLDVLKGDFAESEQGSAVADLRMVSQYELSFGGAIREIGRMVADSWDILLVSLAILLLPGAVWGATHGSPLRDLAPQDGWARLGWMLAIGAAVWPIVWLWMTLVRGNWARWSLVGVLVVGWIAVLGVWIKEYGLRSRESGVRSREARTGKDDVFSLSTFHFSLFTLLLLAFAVRLLAIRDLVFPPWVDASRHGLITAVMRDSGQFLQSYEPYLPVNTPLYHFGFHTLSAGVALVTGREVTDVLLILGQLINALVLVTVYAGVMQITERRAAALFSAFLVGIPFFFPAYYLSWGRYTQLTGMLIMPVLLGETWHFLKQRAGGKEQGEQKEIGGFGRPSSVIRLLPISLLSAGLFLVHFRVFLLYIPFVIVAWLFWRRETIGLLMAGVLGGILVLPKVVQLVGQTRPRAVFTQIGGYNRFPTGYFTVGWEEWFLVGLIGVGALLILQWAQKWEWVRWAVAFGVMAWLVVGEWRGLVPSLAETGFARAAVGSLLIIPVTRWWERWWGRLALAGLLWVGSEFWVGGESLVGVEKVSLLVGLLVIVFVGQMARERGWQRPLLGLAVWVGAMFLLLLGKRIGLPETWVINLNSMVITLFLPIAIGLGIGFSVIWDVVESGKWVVGLLGGLLVGLVVGGLTVYGVVEQVSILNDETVLAHAVEQEAIAWMGENLDEDAKVAVGSWKWLGNAWAAADGGAWIVPLTGLEATTPPADYEYDKSLNKAVSTYNNQAFAIENWGTAEAAELLRESGVTHVYAGIRSSFFRGEELRANEGLELIYHENGVLIFEVK